MAKAAPFVTQPLPGHRPSDASGDDQRRLLVFFDESGQTKDRYMCAGGIAIAESRVAEVRATVDRIKAEAGITSEVKWTNLRGHTLDTYRLLAGYFFALVKDGHAAFNVVVCDFQTFDKRGSGGRGARVSKMFYQFALHQVCWRYGRRCAISLYPDSGEHADALVEYHHHLNSAARRRLGLLRGLTPSPVIEIVPTNSADEPILQLNDIILGGVCYRRNERGLRPDASIHKKKLARLISLRAGSDLFAFNPSTLGGWFNVWNFKAESGATPLRLKC
jgi:hypothetical protein